MLPLSHCLSCCVSHYLQSCVRSTALTCTAGIHLGGTKACFLCAEHLPASPPAVLSQLKSLCSLGCAVQVLLIPPDILAALLPQSRPSGGEGTAAAGRAQDEGETTNLYNLHYFLLALFRYYFRVLKGAFLYLFTRI